MNMNITVPNLLKFENENVRWSLGIQMSQPYLPKQTLLKPENNKTVLVIL